MIHPEIRDISRAGSLRAGQETEKIAGKAFQTFPVFIRRRVMKNDRRFQYLVILLAVILCVTGFTGCRKTPVLEKIVYSDDASEIDYDRYKYELEHNAELDQDFHQTEPDDQEQGEQNYTDAVTGEGNDAADHTSDLEYNANSKNQASGKTGTLSNEHSTTVTPSGAGTQTEVDTPSTGGNGGTGVSGNSGNASGEGTEEESIGDAPEDQPEPSGEEEDTPLQRILDANGEPVDVPETTERIAAVGTAAAYVEMLGGSGRLVATSADFSESGLAAQVFDETVPALWSGNGSSPLSDEAFEQLLSTNPQVCLIESGSSTFSDAQLGSLAASGIEAVTIPKFNTTKNIENAVTLIGRILGDKSSDGGQNAVSNASSFISWRQGILSKVASSCDRYAYDVVDYDNDRSSTKVSHFNGNSDRILYSLYVNDWDDSASWQIFNLSKGAVMNGNGAAASVSGYSSSPLSYYMSLAGVCNTAAAYDDFGTQREWYVNSLYKVDYAIEISGKYNDYTAGNQNSPYLTRTPSKTDYYDLGSPEFQTIIAGTQEIRAKLSDSPLTRYYEEKVNTGLGRFNGFMLSGNAQGSIIVGDYTILTNPHGAAAWDTGSPESPLESLWISAKFGTGISEADLKNEIRNFYLKYYRYELTDAQIDTILQGI